MPSNKVEDALFPVALRDVSVDMLTESVRLKNLRAVVDVETSHVFSVVSSSYTLVTNREAIEIGKQCLELVFGTSEESEMVCRQVIMPSTRSFCHLDFLHRDRRFDFCAFNKDLWQPYMRITNSYNRTHSLKIDLGYFRFLCSNGAIIERGGPEFKFIHNRKSGKLTHSFDRKMAESFRNGVSRFKSSLETLHEFEIERQYVWPLFCKAFGIKAKEASCIFESSADSILNSQQEKHAAICRLTEKYYRELGANAYAVFNIFTDYATRPPENALQLHINGLQKKCGSWINSFSRLVQDRDFRVESYLEDYLSIAS